MNKGYTTIEYADFLAALRDTPRGWRKAEHMLSESVNVGALFLTRAARDYEGTTEPGWDCPWLAVNDRLGVCLMVERDGVDMTGKIFAAADNRHGHDPDVRADLVAACGLAQLAVRVKDPFEPTPMAL